MGCTQCKRTVHCGLEWEDVHLCMSAACDFRRPGALTSNYTRSLTCHPVVVDSPPMGTRSIHPAMSNLMDHGVSPGADVFDGSSAGDDSVWEGNNGIRNILEVENLAIQD